MSESWRVAAMPPVPEMIGLLVEDHADDVAYRFLDIADLTFGEWHARSNQVARPWMDRGLRAGDRVALLLEPAHAPYPSPPTSAPTRQAR
jgi:acyl-CoA synthetase (AMP-forming)/AMP-acid ligase II